MEEAIAVGLFAVVLGFVVTERIHRTKVAVAGAAVAVVAGLISQEEAIDLMTGVERFTFGIPELAGGLGLVPVLTGLFAISEMLERATQLHIVPTRLALDAVRLPSRADFRKCAKAISMSSVLGTIIGILPALWRGPQRR